MTIQEINDEAEKWNIQKADIYPICLGGAENLEGTATAYYMLVHSKWVLNFRRHLHRLLRRAKIFSAFDPKAIYTHITVGYQGSDVHVEDGAYKHSGTCVAGLKIYPFI